jgi:DNA polymerase-3 subunit gamma/tau
MSYQVLARKWRPKSFTEVIGQEHVTRALINALEQNRLHHAYLFTGTRGIGKTTLARIFAKCLNCKSGITSNPCGQCDACQQIDQGRFLDLIEVDAASRTKVEDTRELLDNVQYAASCGRYKIYLIDEVHMLSGHSFNALLKTLEEPPQHVKFLLATTDPQKLPVTVLSRCLQFNLKCIAPEKISKHLADILTKERIDYQPPALQQLAQAADGSIRDALSMLDQAIAYGNNKVTVNDVNAMLCTIEDDYLFELLAALANNDASLILTVINNIASQAADFIGVLEKLLSILHKLAIIQTVPEINDSDTEKLTKFVKLFTPEDIQLYYQIALIGRRDLPLAPSPKSGFEMIMLRMLAFKPATSDEKHFNQSSNKGKRVQHDCEAEPVLRSLGEAEWSNILPQLNISEPTKALAAHCSIGEMQDNHIQLLINPKHAVMLHDKHEQRLSEACSELFQKPIQVSISVSETVLETPSDIANRQNQEKQKKAEETIKKNPNIQAIINNFSATIIPGSIIDNET